MRALGDRAAVLGGSLAKSYADLYNILTLDPSQDRGEEVSVQCSGGKVPDLSHPEPVSGSTEQAGDAESRSA